MYFNDNLHTQVFHRRRVDEPTNYYQLVPTSSMLAWATPSKLIQQVRLISLLFSKLLFTICSLVTITELEIWAYQPTKPKDIQIWDPGE